MMQRRVFYILSICFPSFVNQEERRYLHNIVFLSYRKMARAPLICHRRTVCCANSARIHQVLHDFHDANIYLADIACEVKTERGDK